MKLLVASLTVQHLHDETSVSVCTRCQARAASSVMVRFTTSRGCSCGAASCDYERVHLACASSPCAIQNIYDPCKMDMDGRLDGLVQSVVLDFLGLVLSFECHARASVPVICWTQFVLAFENCCRGRSVY